jgi:hypothetical protein
VSTSLGALTLFLDADSSKLYKSLADLEQRLKKLEGRPVSVPVVPDSSGLPQGVTDAQRSAQQQADKAPVSVPVVPDSSGLPQGVTDAQKGAQQQADKTPVSVPVVADPEPLDRGVDGAQRSAQERAKKNPIRVPLEPEVPPGDSSGGGSLGKALADLTAKLKGIRGDGSIGSFLQGLSAQFGGKGGAAGEGLAGSIGVAVGALGEIGLAVEGVGALFGVWAGRSTNSRGRRLSSTAPRYRSPRPHPSSTAFSRTGLKSRTRPRRSASHARP